MENTTELIKLLTACFSLIAAVISVVLLFKNKKSADNPSHANLVNNNSGIVNQYGNSYNYADNRTHVNQTQIVYNTSSSQANSSSDIIFVAVCGLLVFPFTDALEEYQWILKAIILLMQFIILFCIYKNVRICLPSESTFTNIIFFISPLLLIVMNESPSFFGADIMDFGTLPSAVEKIFRTSIILITYVAFLMMLLSHISSLISPKIASPKIKRFFEKTGRLWELALFFQIIALFIIFTLGLTILKKL